jgi:hypothetical protein
VFGFFILQALDHVEVTLDGDVERRAGDLLSRIFFEPERPSFEEMFPPPGNFKRIGRSCTAGLALALAELPPLNEVAALRKCVPIVAAFVGARHRDESPTVSDLHLL